MLKLYYVVCVLFQVCICSANCVVVACACVLFVLCACVTVWCTSLVLRHMGLCIMHEQDLELATFLKRGHRGSMGEERGGPLPRIRT